MPIVNINPNASKQSYSQPGKYQGKVVGVKVGEYGGKSPGTYLEINTMFEGSDGKNCFARTKPFGRGHTNLGENTGSAAAKVCAQLGCADPENPEEEELVNTPVLVQVGLSDYENKDGEKVYKNEIEDIWKA